MSGGGEASARMLARIRALLAKAEDPAATRAEAEALFAKAADLMAKYGIDRAMLAASDPSTDRVGDRVFTPEAPYAYDKVLLLNTIAQALGAQAMYKRGPRGEYQLHVFAMGADLERIDLLFTSLLVQATRFMTADLASAVGYRDVKVWKRDWLRGFAAEVWRRLRDAEERARRQAEQERRPGGASVELVLLDRRVLVERRFREAYPRVRWRVSRRQIGYGYAQGQAAGRRADLGGTRLGSRARAALPR